MNHSIQDLLSEELFVKELSHRLVEPLLYNRNTIDDEGGQRHNNVVGFGIGHKQRAGLEREELCLVVFVREKLPAKELRRELRLRGTLAVNLENLGRIHEEDVYRINPEYENVDPPGIFIDVQAIGSPKVDGSGTYTGYARPAKAGISCGWKQDATGTIGCFVRDRKTGAICILTAAHVLGRYNKASAGDKVIQPGGDDGGFVVFIDPTNLKRPQDYYHVGEFVRSAVVSFSPNTPTNTADAAIAKLINQNEYRSLIEGGVGTPVAEGTPKDGMLVHKTGRTSGYTIGKITNVSSSFRINVGSSSVDFHDLITTTVMSKEGDSGSLLLSLDGNRALGILLGSSDNRSFFTKFSNAAAQLDIELP